MTNIHTNPRDPCTLVANDYYHNLNMKQKLLSTTLDFLDEDFYLKDHQNLIDEAQSFSDFVKQLKTTGNTTRYDPLAIPILRLPQEELPKIRRKRHLFTSYTPQISQEWTTFINLGMSATFMILAGGFYCSWHKHRQSMGISLLISGLLPTTRAQQAEDTSIDFYNGFSIESHCLSSETLIGWIGVCQNKQSVLYLNTHPLVHSMLYFESYQMINGHRQSVNGTWENTLSMHPYNVNTSPETIYPLLPPHWKAWLIEEKKQQQVWLTWKNYAVMTSLTMLADGMILLTPMGNLYKTFGLTLDWKIREDRYLLNRCGFAFEQYYFQSNSIFTPVSLYSISTELALLHPSAQNIYKVLTMREDFYQVKFLIRFVIDILQLGFYNVGHLANILEYCFPANESVKNMGLGLRMANFFLYVDQRLELLAFRLSIIFVTTNSSAI